MMLEHCPEQSEIGRYDMRKKKRNGRSDASTPEERTTNEMHYETNPADQVFFPEMYTRQKSYYRDSLGDSTAQSLAVMARPNAYMALVNGGYVESLGQGPGNNRRDSEALWYHSEIDVPVASELFMRLDANVRRRILYNENDVLIYLTSLAGMIAKYTAIVSWYSHLSSNVGTLGDFHIAMPEFMAAMIDPPSSDTDYIQASSKPKTSIISESNQWIEMVATAMETFAFPSMWQSEITELFSMHRLGPFDDSPVGGYMPSSNSGSAAIDNIGAAGTIPTIRELWSQIRNFQTHPFMTKISADMQSGLGMSNISLSRVMSGETFTLPWMDLWHNSGWIHDDRNIINPNDSVIPNAASSDEGKRYTLPFDFLTTPTDMLLANMVWGLGNEYSGIRSWFLSNVKPGVKPNYTANSDAINASKDALPVLAFTAGNTKDDASITRVDGNIGFGAGAYVSADNNGSTWSDLASAIGALTKGDLEGSVTTVAEYIAKGAMYTNGSLGWKRTLQFVNSVFTDDEMEGFVQESPIVGRRYYADPFAIQAHAYDRYRTLVGLK
jgi:hypothetical protein